MGTPRFARLLAVALTASGLLAGCTSTPTVPNPTTPDNSPPTVRLSSAGLPADFNLSETSTAMQLRRAKRSDQVLVVATAEDLESGISEVLLDVTVRKFCGTVAQVQTFPVVQRPTASGGLPVRLSASWTVVIAQQRPACSASPAELQVSVQATAVNGSGRQTVLPKAVVSSFGPDLLRVATFNLYQPGNHADAVYQAWGRDLGNLADVLLLTEVPDQRRAELLAQAAGMGHVHKMSNGDVAIASRWPLRDIQEQVIDPPGRLSSNNSNILSAVIDIAGWPHRFIATHWGIRDANDVLAPADTSAPARLQAAQAITALAVPSPAEVFVGGDLNAYSGFGPQEPPGSRVSTQEASWLRDRFNDAFTAMRKGDGDHCSNQRIDYVMARGAYTPVLYEACRNASPSDHPFVLVHYAAGP
jgi:hypothetical protein